MNMREEINQIKVKEGYFIYDEPTQEEINMVKNNRKLANINNGFIYDKTGKLIKIEEIASDEETKMLIELEKLKNIRAIKSISVAFLVFTIIGICLSLISSCIPM